MTIDLNRAKYGRFANKRDVPKESFTEEDNLYLRLSRNQIRDLITLLNIYTAHNETKKYIESEYKRLYGG